MKRLFQHITLSYFIIFLLYPCLLISQSADTTLARTYLQKALILADSTQYDSALIINQQAVLIFEKKAEQHVLALADLYNNAGDCYQELGNYQEALAYFKKSLALLSNMTKSSQKNIETNSSTTNIWATFQRNIHQRLTKTYNHFGVLYMTLGDFETAFHYHQQALELRLQLWGERHEKVADSYNNIGNCFISVGDYEQALAAHELALDIRQKNLGKQHLDVATSYNNLGSCWLSKGQAKQALPFYKKALNIRQQQLGQSHAKTAQSLKNMGNTYQYLGDFERSIDFYQQALNIDEKTYGQQHIQLAGTYHNIGAGFSKKGDYQQSLFFYKKALTIQLKTYGQQHPEIADSYSNMGNAYLEKGDYKLAENFFRQAMNMRQHIYGSEHEKVALSFDNLGVCYRYMGDVQKAAQQHVEALNIQKKVLGESHFYVGGTHSNLANCFLNCKAYPEALENYEIAQEIFKNMLGENHPYLVANYGNLGVCYLKTKQYKKALTNLEKALTILQQTSGEHHHTEAKYYKNIGQIYQEQGQFQTALDFYKKGLNHLGFYKKNIASPSLELLDLLTAQAKTQFKIYQKKPKFKELAAIALAYEQSLELMDTLRQTFQEQESKQILAQNSYPIFEETIAVYFEQWKQSGEISFLEKAFALSEKSKSLILLEALQKSNADNFAGIPDSLLRQEYQLRIDLAYLEKKRDNKVENISKSYSDTLENEIFETRQEYQNLIETFEQNYPDYYQLKYDRSTISMEFIQKKLLDPDQAMLHYFTGDSSVYVFMIMYNKIDAFQIKNNFPIDDWVKQLRNGILNYPFAEADNLKTVNQNYLSSAYQLYQKIISPISEQHELPKRLIIVPDGALGFLPFDALIKELPTQSARFKTHQYLLDDFAISYSFSATFLARISEKKQAHNQQKVLAFAPTFKNNSLKLSELKFNKKEAKDVLSLLDGDLWENESATLDNFLRQAEDYYILHLATHGKTNLNASEYSYLAFTEVKDSLDNELLYVKDLYNMRLKAAMVVLSACETGIGEYQRGEGIVSLARAFSYAGASSIITTLWSINDKKTAELMTLFYKNIKSGLPKDVALQQAKRDFIITQSGHDEGHPYFWSGYVAVGEMEALDFGWSWWIWGGFGLFFCGILFFFVLRWGHFF